MNESGFMTVKEVAEYLRLKPLAIYRMEKGIKGGNYG